MIKFSLLGETILEWNDKDIEHYHARRMAMDSMLCRFKARVLDSHQSEGINGVVRDCMEDDAIVFSDKSTSYVDISDLVELHVTEKSDAKTTKETLKWVHITISNAKRTLLGNYHKIKRKYLQLYLNEFIYKLNRRYFGDKLFDRLVIANITGA